AGAESWIARHNGHSNLYYNPNAVRPGLSGRASKADIVSVRFVHVDIDPRKGLSGTSLQEEQQRLLGLLRGVPLEPSVIIFSGGGFNALWALEEPLGDDGIARV